MTSHAANVTINAVCPAIVATALPPAGALEKLTEAQLTPMSTIMRCFSELASLHEVGKATWVETGKNGEIVEGNPSGLVYHAAPKRPSSSSNLDESALRAWQEAYQQRNKEFAERDW